MSRSSAPPPSVEGLSIEIDPNLIEEALAAVERRLGSGPADSTEAAAPAESEVEIDLDAPRPPPPSPDDERRRLQFRISDQAEHIRRLEGDIAREVETRDNLERQLREVRRAHGDLGQEFERFRTRAKRDLEEAERRGEDRAIRPMVDIYDNVERAWLHAVSDPAQILGGLQMIVEQFKRLLERLGFERIDAERGVPFDPAAHEAVLHVRTADAPVGTIVDEVQAGFRLRGRLFRPARVTVAAPSSGSAD